MRLCPRELAFDEEPFFTVDPLTARGRLCQFLGLAMIPLIPCFSIVIYASVNLAYVVQDYEHILDVRDAFLAGAQVTSVISALHDEMGGGTSMIVSNGSEIIDSSQEIYRRTDENLAKFQHWSELETVGVWKERFFAHLEAERQRLATLNTTVKAVLDFYATHAGKFSEWMDRKIDIDIPLAASSSFDDYHAAVQCMHQLAIVRSLGVVALLRGFMTEDEHVWFAGSMDLFVAKLNFNENFLVDEDVETLNDMALPAAYATVFGLYRVVTELSHPARPDLYQSLVWYRRLSSSYNGLARISHSRLERILAAVDQQTDSKVVYIVIYVIFIGTLLFIASPFIIFSARQSVLSLHGFAAVMEMKLLEIKRERRKTEAVLNEMLPRIISYKLRKGESTPAEQYASATVFFSDIEDFSEISAQSSPIDIVVFLNDMYTHMDTLLDKGYDTYKVETIGSVYMVASGVPGRNGTKHASEIARMSLDLMHSTETFVIPHLPDNPLQLRAGIHSGPVVAGVVGNKMPRYCLFGDTVNTASRMQSNSLARHIQISHATKELLDEIGGFTTSERGLINIKGKGAMRTYWLLSRERKHTGKPCNNTNPNASSVG